MMYLMSQNMEKGLLVLYGIEIGDVKMNVFAAFPAVHPFDVLSSLISIQ